MSGLVSYQSSSDDEADDNDMLQRKEEGKEQADNMQQTTDGLNDIPGLAANTKVDGPVLGPSGLPELDSLSEPSYAASHFSAVQMSRQNLTLPPVPNLDIPASPPGSPDPDAEAKFAHFLTLKKQGVHFNEKLASSASLKNPSLLAKLRSHMGIDDRAQYSTTLPKDIWDASALPDWGYKEELLKAQQKIRREVETKRAMSQRDSIEFTHSSSSNTT